MADYGWYFRPCRAAALQSRFTTRDMTTAEAEGAMDKAQGSMTRYFTPRTDIAPMPRALFGQGMFQRAGDEARKMGMRRALVVTTGLRGTGFADELLAIFREAG